MNQPWYMHTHSAIGSTVPHPKQPTKQPFLASESTVAPPRPWPVPNGFKGTNNVHPTRWLQKCLAQCHAPASRTKDERGCERATDAEFIGSVWGKGGALCGISEHKLGVDGAVVQGNHDGCATGCMARSETGVSQDHSKRFSCPWSHVCPAGTSSTVNRVIDHDSRIRRRPSLARHRNLRH